MGAANYIENRWSQRRSLDMDVDITFDGGRMDAMRSRDVGLGGVFIYVEPAQQLMNDTDVELYFLVGRDEIRRAKHKLRARVVRQTNEGMGLMFRDFDTGSFRALQEVMRHAAQPR